MEDTRGLRPDPPGRAPDAPDATGRARRAWTRRGRAQTQTPGALQWHILRTFNWHVSLLALRFDWPLELAKIALEDRLKSATGVVILGIRWQTCRTSRERVDEPQAGRRRREGPRGGP